MKRILLLLLLAGVGCEGRPEPSAVDTLHWPALDGTNADACVDPPSGLVSWWPGDGSPADIVGLNTGTLIGGATFAAGKVGQAFSLDGVDDYVDLGNDASLHLTNGDFTVDAWVYFNALTHPPGGNTGGPQGDMSILDKMSVDGTYPNMDGWRLIKQADNRFWFCLGGGGSNGCGVASHTIYSTTSASANTWFHVAVVKSNPGFAMYVNGVLQAGPSSLSFTDNNTANLRIGSYPREGAHLNGMVDEVEVFNRALTVDEIAAIYAAGSAGKCKSQTIQVEIDIKPGSDPNCFNNDGNGVIPVAILGSASFNVRDVDPASAQLDGMSVSARGKSNKLLAHYEDTNGDGFEDLVLQIEDADGTFASGSGTATLLGSLFDGTLIEGTDEICIVP